MQKIDEEIVKYHEANSVLLGDFDSDKQYVLKSKIVEKLIEISKCIVEFKLDYLICESYFKDFTLKFKVAFKIEGEKKIAYLYLVENIEIDGDKKSLETYIVTYSDIDDNKFLDKLKNVFSLYIKDESEGKQIVDDEMIETIINGRKNKSKALETYMGLSSKYYVENMIKALKKEGQFGKDILLEFKSLLKDLNRSQNQNKYYINSKNLLVKLLKNNEKTPTNIKNLMGQMNDTMYKKYLDKKNEKPKEVKKHVAKKSKNKSKSFSAKYANSVFLDKMDFDLCHVENVDILNAFDEIFNNGKKDSVTSNKYNKKSATAKASAKKTLNKPKNFDYGLKDLGGSIDMTDDFKDNWEKVDVKVDVEIDYVNITKMENERELKDKHIDIDENIRDF